MSILMGQAVTLTAATLADLARQALARYQAADAEERIASIAQITAQSHRDDALRQFAGLAQALEVQVVEWGDDAPFSRDELETVGDGDPDIAPAGCAKLWRMACAAAEQPRRY